jgi:hypothetical protein
MSSSDKPMRIYCKTLGGHVHCRFFTTGSMCGELVFTIEEWPRVQKFFQTQFVELINETPTALSAEHQDTVHRNGSECLDGCDKPPATRMLITCTECKRISNVVWLIKSGSQHCFFCLPAHMQDGLRHDALRSDSFGESTRRALALAGA